MRPLSRQQDLQQRQGVVLLVVIAMLTMFAVVGLGFVYYAESQAATGLQTLAAENKLLADHDPEMLLSYFLGQFIYGTDPNNGGYSALRGHTLASNMYGFNRYAVNAVPFNGVGRLNYQFNSPPDPAILNGQSNAKLVNYQYFATDGFIRDPEFQGTRLNPSAPILSTNYRAGNAPYTYPDLNNLFLASVNANGEVLKPSFYTDNNWTGVDFTNNATPIQKYLTPAVHGSWHPGFDPSNALFPKDANLPPDGLYVRNLDFGKGRKTGPNTYANNDSPWLDLGFPIWIAPNGKKYKALFAPLIIDLDNRLHLWAAGNTRNGGAPISNSGYGPSEINPVQAGIAAADMSFLIGLRTAAPAFNAAPYPAQWPLRDGPANARIDFDGLNGGALALPNPGNASYATPQYFVFPDFPRNVPYTAPNTPWYNSIPAGPVQIPELANHPLGYNYAADPKRAPAAWMEAILRYKQKNGPAVTSDVFKRMQTSILANDRLRGLVTLSSWHFDRPTASPFLNFDPTVVKYSYNAGDPYPKLAGGANASPNPPGSAAAAFSEYSNINGSEYRSALANQLRVNLNRLMGSAFDYPTPDGTGFIDRSVAATDTQYKVAQNARADNVNHAGLAFDLYKLLIQVTGAQDPNLVGMTTTDPRYQAARYLAQLAANIVDYIDNDDISTPFQWYYIDPNSINSPEFVFGTELPRVVLNEALCQLDNVATDLNAVTPDLSRATGYRLNAWVELHNPFKDTSAEAFPLDGGKARLNVGATGSAAYQIVLSQFDANLRSLPNNQGNAAVANVLSTANTWGTGGALTTVLPANGAFKDALQTNNGFFVVGPSTTFIGGVTIGGNTLTTRDPALPTTYKTTQLSAVVPIAQAGNVLANGTTILLQRLACPYIAPDNNPANATYNPYITVDYVEKLNTYDNRLFSDTAVVGPPPAESAYKATGRKQPYAANSAYLMLQAPAPALAGQPQNTFYRHNSIENAAPPSAATVGQTLDIPFDWLVHLDRPVINALELMHVSGYRPHELTQQFITTPGGVTTKFTHRAPWGWQASDQDALIYRALEMVGVPSRMNGCFAGSREPGRVNINTMNEPEVWRALVDQNAMSRYTAADVDAVFSRLILSRTPSPIVAPSPSDRPFRGLLTGPLPAADAQYPSPPFVGGAGLQDTILRQGLFQYGVPAVHPYQQAEMMQKIFNNTTYTSNVFAMWLTVGFFEVLDDSVRPAKLGAEVGRADNRQIRHRFFAIIDRSEVAIYRGAATYATVGAGAPSLTFTLPAALTVRAGDVAFAEVNGQETAAMTWDAVNSKWKLSAPLVSAAAGSVNIVVRGNPGAQTNYNPRNDSLVVPHFTVIE